MSAFAKCRHGGLAVKDPGPHFFDVRERESCRKTAVLTRGTTRGRKGRKRAETEGRLHRVPLASFARHGSSLDPQATRAVSTQTGPENGGTVNPTKAFNIPP